MYFSFRLFKEVMHDPQILGVILHFKFSNKLYTDSNFLPPIFESSAYSTPLDSLS